MPNFNKVILVGHLTKTPDIKTVKENTVGTCGIAVNRKYKDKNETMFIDFTCFGKLAEILGQYTAKGSAVMIEGRLDFQQWESEGQKRSKHVVIIESLQLLGKNSDTNSNQTNNNQQFDNIKDEDVPF